MINSYKSSVPLGKIVPGDNPRSDFGDIDALAATIEATGGQPINPIVVVADGNRYRIVDGERRYKALCKMHEPTHMVDVLVFTDFGQAQEAVAMVATDDKMQLSEAEKAKGFQQMMLLGVDSRTIARSMRRKTADVAKARAVAKMAPAQATLDQMIAAAEMDTDEDRKAVLEAEPDKWERKAADIRRARENEAKHKELRDCIARLGLEIEERQPEGYVSIMWAETPAEMERMVEAHEGEDLAVWPAPFNSRFYYLGHRAEDGRSAETPEQRAAREWADRLTAAYNTLRDELLKEVATCDVFPELQALAGRLRDGTPYADELLADRLRDLGVMDKIVEEHLRGPASMWELLTQMRRTHVTLPWHKWVLTWLPPVLEDGAWDATEEDMWLFEQAKAEEGGER